MVSLTSIFSIIGGGLKDAVKTLGNYLVGGVLLIIGALLNALLAGLLWLVSWVMKNLVKFIIVPLLLFLLGMAASTVAIGYKGIGGPAALDVFSNSTYASFMDKLDQYLGNSSLHTSVFKMPIVVVYITSPGWWNYTGMVAAIEKKYSVLYLVNLGSAELGSLIAKIFEFSVVLFLALFTLNLAWRLFKAKAEGLLGELWGQVVGLIMMLIFLGAMPLFINVLGHLPLLSLEYTVKALADSPGLRLVDRISTVLSGQQLAQAMLALNPISSAAGQPDALKLFFLIVVMMMLAFMYFAVQFTIITSLMTIAFGAAVTLFKTIAYGVLALLLFPFMLIEAVLQAGIKGGSYVGGFAVGMSPLSFISVEMFLQPFNQLGGFVRRFVSNSVMRAIGIPVLMLILAIGAIVGESISGIAVPTNAVFSGGSVSVGGLTLSNNTSTLIGRAILALFFYIMSVSMILAALMGFRDLDNFVQSITQGALQIAGQITQTAVMGMVMGAGTGLAIGGIAAGAAGAFLTSAGSGLLSRLGVGGAAKTIESLGLRLSSGVMRAGITARDFLYNLAGMGVAGALPSMFARLGGGLGSAANKSLAYGSALGRLVGGGGAPRSATKTPSVISTPGSGAGGQARQATRAQRQAAATPPSPQQQSPSPGAQQQQQRPSPRAPSPSGSTGIRGRVRRAVSRAGEVVMGAGELLDRAGARVQSALRLPFRPDKLLTSLVLWGALSPITAAGLAMGPGAVESLREKISLLVGRVTGTGHAEEYARLAASDLSLASRHLREMLGEELRRNIAPESILLANLAATGKADVFRDVAGFLEKGELGKALARLEGSNALKDVLGWFGVDESRFRDLVNRYVSRGFSREEALARAFTELASASPLYRALEDAFYMMRRGHYGVALKRLEATELPVFKDVGSVEELLTRLRGLGAITEGLRTGKSEMVYAGAGLVLGAHGSLLSRVPVTQLGVSREDLEALVNELRSRGLMVSEPDKLTLGDIAAVHRHLQELVNSSDQRVAGAASALLKHYNDRLAKALRDTGLLKDVLRALSSPDLVRTAGARVERLIDSLQVLPGVAEAMRLAEIYGVHWPEAMEDALFKAIDRYVEGIRGATSQLSLAHREVAREMQRLAELLRESEKRAGKQPGPAPQGQPPGLLGPAQLQQGMVAKWLRPPKLK